jgi:hypothetical protein
MSISEVLVAERRTLRVPYPASQAVNVGDLMYWDNSAKFGKPAELRADTGSAAGNQADFTPIFLGVSADMRLATETSVTVVATAPSGPSDRVVVPEGIFDCTCASATFEFGDLVGIARDSVNSVNLPQQVVGVSESSLAIGFVLKREPSAVTKVRCYLSAYSFGWFKGKSQGVLGFLPGEGIGGAVTQATSRTTGVTLNTLVGAITLFAAAGSATPFSFTVTNSQVAATDIIDVVQKSGTDLWQIFVTNVSAGSFKITAFTTGGATNESPVFNFVVIKGAAS